MILREVSLGITLVNSESFAKEMGTDCVGRTH